MSTLNPVGCATVPSANPGLPSSIPTVSTPGTRVAGVLALGALAAAVTATRASASVGRRRLIVSAQRRDLVPPGAEPLRGETCDGTRGDQGVERRAHACAERRALLEDRAVVLMRRDLAGEATVQ